MARLFSFILVCAQFHPYFYITTFTNIYVDMLPVTDLKSRLFAPSLVWHYLNYTFVIDELFGF